MQSDCKLPFPVVPTGRYRRGLLDAPDAFCVEGRPDYIMGRLGAHGLAATVPARTHPHRLYIESEHIWLYCHAIDALGAALLDSTGTMPFVIFMRTMARHQHLRLTPSGLYRGDNKIHGKTEEGIFKALGMPVIPPTDRNVKGKWHKWELWKKPEYAQLRRSIRSGASRRKQN